MFLRNAESVGCRAGQGTGVLQERLVFLRNAGPPNRSEVPLRCE